MPVGQAFTTGIDTDPTLKRAVDMNSSVFGGTPTGAGGKQNKRENTNTSRSYVEPTANQALLTQMGVDKIQGFTPPEVKGAPVNATQQSAQQQALAAAAGPQQALANKGAQASNFLLGDVLFPGSNPALQATIDAANTAGNRNLQREVLPAIRSNAVTTGNFDSSRRGIAEGIAASDAETNARNVAAQISTAGYGMGLQGMQSALGYLPQTQGAQLAPAATTAAVGDTQQGQAQSQLDIERINAMLPYLHGQDLIGTANSLQGGTSVGQTTSPRRPFMEAIGALGGLAGALLPG